MSAEHREDEKLTDVETALRSLVPKGSRIDRDRLMYLAGQVSMRQPENGWHHWRHWAWPSATVAMTILAATFGALLLQSERASRSVILAGAGDRRETEKPRTIPPAHTNDASAAPLTTETQTASSTSRRPSALVNDTRLLAQTLSHGINPFADFKTFPAASASEVRERPKSNRQLLDSLLDQPTMPTEPAASTDSKPPQIPEENS